MAITLTNSDMISDLAPGDFAAAAFAVLTATVISYAGSSSPDTDVWLVCDGAAVSRTEYAALFAVAGTTYGVGDGATTFNVPDLRGRSTIGVGTGDAADATAWAEAEKQGTETHTLTLNETVAHEHGSGLGIASSDDPEIVVYSTQAASTDDNVSRGSSPGTLEALTETVGGGNAHNNMHPVLGMIKLIKT